METNFEAHAGETWTRACGIVKEKLGEDNFSRLIEPMVPVSFTGGILVMQVDNDFLKAWITESYLGLIRDAVRLASGNSFAEVNLTVSKEQTPLPDAGMHDPAPHESHAAEYRPSRKSAPGVPLNPDYTFANFVVGPSNSFAEAAARGVAKNPGTAYNPLFIYGETGLGKTHIMQAIGREAISRNPRLVVCYTSSEDLLNNYLESLRNNTTSEFRKRYRNIDILLIDDIHFMANKKALQEEFFHTFNTLQNNQKQIVMTSDRSLNDIEGLEERLVSRFQQGLITSIERPDFETRLAILKNKQKNAVTKIPDNILYFIAENITSNVRKLEGALTRVQVHASMITKCEPTIDDVRSLLRDTLEHEMQPDLTFHEIQRTVASQYGLTMSDMTSTVRSQNIAFPRQVAMFLCRKLTKASLPEIAGAFEKTHATILHACKAVMDRMSTDHDQILRIETIVRKLGRDPETTIRS